MATAKEKVGRITERIPHNTVAYAFLELEAANVNEFESLREEALGRHPEYSFALNKAAANTPQSAAEKAAFKAAMKAAEKKGADVGPAPSEDAASSQADESGDVTPGATTPPPAPAERVPTSTEGLTPREIARQRLLAKKGA